MSDYKKDIGTDPALSVDFGAIERERDRLIGSVSDHIEIRNRYYSEIVNLRAEVEQLKEENEKLRSEHMGVDRELYYEVVDQRNILASQVASLRHENEKLMAVDYWHERYQSAEKEIKEWKLRHKHLAKGSSKILLALAHERSINTVLKESCADVIRNSHDIIAKKRCSKAIAEAEEMRRGE